ncbi:isocitrate/isopropylmalate dehydrogenase family protein [Paralcaligenes ureilyticus]|uniref:3-isopropylmalate dehydrogenase n=1 Tax=Paralcaligenes ureilyticus TaxID=627131 RepID=A0A4R3MB19_9BURK|nr:isocitrate/isopropylmalate family dehydrogenase [Paralcaligenes ureilyticus]TCT10814.1 3-isopropylmalate dehydrogenase [Paralcaligenes ureilyticus]
MKIVVLPGDGIGPETMAATTQILRTISDLFGLGLDLVHDMAGHDSLKLHGATVTEALLEKVKSADGLLLGPMATYDFKDESKGEINPSKYFRKELDLYANIRPARTYKGMKARLGEFDLVVVRENTEGFYADRNIESGSSEMLITPDVVVSLRRITRKCCERIARSAFNLAMSRNRHVSIVHKANVLKIGDGMFIDICRDVAREFPEVKVDDFIVDAMMAHVVRAPQRFDVIVTTNMFGDILSDLTAELSGSLGLGGSLNAGDRYAMGQAAHGSAPDIAGKDIANPFSVILSAAMLLNWHGQKNNKAEFLSAGKAIFDGVAHAIEAGEATKDVGGKLGTKETGAALARRLSNL